jgi:DNA repair protein RecN (Recombination protein N)
MLKSLFIKNYALIDELTVEFSNGLMIITGETGAGKSIVIGALGLILGERASADTVRGGSDRAVVEGIFAISGNKKVKALLGENDFEVADELIVRREVSTKGQSRCFVNDSPATAAFLKTLGELLVDLHGQHEHQSLLRVETHADMVDEFGGLEGLVAEVRTAVETLASLTGELYDLKGKEQELRERRDIHEFQLHEINAVDPQGGEEEKLEMELRVLENAEKLSGMAARVYEMLYEGDHSVHDQLVVVRNQLQNLAGIDNRFEPVASECGSAVAIVSELARFVQSYSAGVEFAPTRLEELRERLGRLSHLKKKYGGSLEVVLEHRDRIAKEVALAGNYDTVIAKLADEVEQQRTVCAHRSRTLSAKRAEAAKRIDKTIVGELARLGIPGARFETRISATEIDGAATNDGSFTGQYVKVGRKHFIITPKGYDVVEFHISTNAGEELRPLARVASGGEVSRIMLALKSILAKADRLPVLIFDEIDVGVSGRVAQAVGMALKSLSDFHQVIAITHLPQIAGLADMHYSVFKSETNGRATTSIRKLSTDERVHEVAKLMSGAEVTDAGLKGARELMSLPADS